MARTRSPSALVIAATLAVMASAQERHSRHDRRGVVGLDVYAQGATFDLLTAVKEEKAVELYHQRSRDGGLSWGKALRIDTGPSGVYRPRRGSDPQIVAVRDRLVAVWTAPGPSKSGSGPLAAALSADGGRTWTRGPSPAGDQSRKGQGFADLTASPSGTMVAVWLDERNGRQGLYAAASRDFGKTWEADRTVDDATCECCWNRVLAPTEGRTTVIYRDRDPRDLAVAATTDGGRSWLRLSRAGSFDWDFHGCPEVGGDLARDSSGRLLALSWTGAEDREGLYALSSRDEGRSWGEPRRIGGARARHGALAATGDRIAAVWDDGGSILASVTADGGATWSAPRYLSQASVRASHPLVVATRDAFRAFWTESGEDAPAWNSAPF